jgi:type VI secretion system protein ImpL
MQGIDSAATLLAPLRTTVPPALAFDVAPEFKGGEGREIGRDQIAQWQMTIGPASAVEGVPGKPLPWNLGDPLAIAIRFARDSPHRPEATVPGALVEDRTVRFAYDGRWSLMRLLRAAQPAPADRARLADAASVLAFEIPVVRDQSTPPLAGADPGAVFKLFMRLRLFAPGKAEPLPIVEWPVQAPAQLLCVASR